MKHLTNTPHFYGMGICVVCGATYPRYNANVKCCSDGCKKKRNRQKRDEWGLKNPDYQKGIKAGTIKTKKHLDKTATKCLSAKLEECLNCTRSKCVFDETED